MKRFQAIQAAHETAQQDLEKAIRRSAEPEDDEAP